MLQKTASNSQLILQYLKGLEPGNTFTSASIRLAIPSVTDGSITGFLNKLLKDGAIKQVNTSRNSQGRLIRVYEIIDLSTIQTRGISSKGGKPGREMNNSHTSRKAIVETLFVVIEQMERLKSDIEDFSIDELLKEIKRRTEK